MKKVLKWTGIVVAGLIVVMVVYSLFGMQKTLGLSIGDVNLSRLPDGSYTGSYTSYRWSNTVEVTVKDHRITSIEPVIIPQGRDAITETLIERVLEAQTPAVDAVSGATANSNAFLKAVENALGSAAASP